ncbi:hypothetical protein EJ02DRAFT_460361 [Clathrospora elynae]|uniref:Uncharacterized protein n=1 Tax=Clathrospora elynae TaxID=706981 RepID=A0A6A5S464_9PLEO|nr:hypothetical protein EJ02DRAFT_460361 [Clathrospora elynae]
MIPVPTVHTENTADGFETDAPQETPPPESIRSVFHPPHLEWSESVFNEPTTTSGPRSPTLVSTQYSTDFPPEVTQPPAPTVFTHSGLTIQSVPVMTAKTATGEGGLVRTSKGVDYQYVINSITLVIGSPTTINNIPVALTVDSSGSTVLIAGEMTTTLSVPASVPQMAQTPDAAAAITIATTVVEGTTKYIIAGQTLAPGHPITVGNIPMSIATGDGSTVLIVGDMTTTFTDGHATKITTELGPSTAAPPGDASFNQNTEPSSTNVKAGATRVKSLESLFATVAGIAALILTFD